MTTSAAPTLSQPVVEGPTWRRDPLGRFVLPRHTIGWDILGWTKEMLRHPDGARATDPWQFTPEQARWLLWWYAVNERGQFTARRGVLRRLKGWGKDPIGSVILAVEFVGPCEFGGFRDDGSAIAVRPSSSWVQTAAVSKDQTRSTMTLFPGLFSPACISDYGIDIGKEILYADKGQRRLEAVTSSPRSMEGARTRFVLENEIEHWLANNEGHDMAAVIARNAAKVGGRVLGIGNAHNPGEDSVGERSYEAYKKIQSGASRARGVMYDSIEAPADTVLADRDSLRAGLMAARGDSSWLDVERLIEEIYDPETSPSIARRFYLNQIVAAEDAWVSPQEWNACAKPGYQVPQGAAITLGFDGSKSDDHTALVGCEVLTGHLFTLGGPWDPAAEESGEIDRAKVDAAVARAFANYDVVGFYSDVAPWESYIDTWSETFGDQLCARATARHPIAWDMRTRTQDTTRAAEQLHEAIIERDLSHGGSAVETQYVLNARNRPNNYGLSFGKEHRMSARKVDWLAAAMLARLACMDYIALPENKKRKAVPKWPSIL